GVVLAGVAATPRHSGSHQGCWCTDLVHPHLSSHVTRTATWRSRITAIAPSCSRSTLRIGTRFAPLSWSDTGTSAPVSRDSVPSCWRFPQTPSGRTRHSQELIACHSHCWPTTRLGQRLREPTARTTCRGKRPAARCL